MTNLIATHHLLVQILALPAGLAIGIGIAALALHVRRETAPAPAALLRLLAENGPRHLLDETAEHTGDDDYQPRHAADYLPRHEADATGTAVVLGAHPDGDITLVHADPPVIRLADQPTEERGALVGATA